MYICMYVYMYILEHLYFYQINFKTLKWISES